MPPEERMVDVALRGLPVASQARLRAVDAQSAFIEHDAPPPVGSRLMVRDGAGEREVRVLAVVELEAGAKVTPGMKVTWSAPVAVAAKPDPTPVAAKSESTPEASERAATDGESAASEPGEPSGDDAAGNKKKRKNRRTLK